MRSSFTDTFIKHPIRAVVVNLVEDTAFQVVRRAVGLDEPSVIVAVEPQCGAAVIVHIVILNDKARCVCKFCAAALTIGPGVVVVRSIVI